MENYSLSDIATAANDGGFGGNSAWILILLFAMIFGWGGNGLGARTGDFGQFATSASQSEILLGQQFQSLDNKIDRLGNGISDATFALNNSVNGVQTNLGGAITSEGRAIQSQLAQCCCDNQKNVDSLRFDMANYASAIQQNDTANTQKILDAISTNRMADMQNQINQLQLANALAGVVKYPMLTAYSSGSNPFCSCGCNGI